MGTIVPPVAPAGKLYLPLREAAEWSGIGRNALAEYLDSADPPPFLRVGRTRYIQAAALPAYLERKQEVVAR